MPEVHHETAFFTGRVQGVGFRYAALQVAKEFEVSGYVSNLPDGRVVLEAEGTPQEVEAYLAAVGERMDGYVRKVDRHHSVRAPQFSGFSIR
jgi:acylphosphatase